MASTLLADTCYILDFDRCLGDTDRLHAALALAVEDLTSVTFAELDQLYNNAVITGGSLDSVEYLEELLRRHNCNVSWEQVQQRFLQIASRSDMCEPGARELLHAFDAKQIPYAIVTYGGQRWQQAKLAAAGLSDVPYMITNIRRKGMLLASWQNTSGAFAIPAELGGRAAKHVVLVDDKAVSFEGLPSHASGYHVIWADRPQLVGQMGIVPPTVAIVTSLTEIIKKI